MAADRAMRASDQDRESAAELLRQAYIEGRLSREELDERAAAVYSATTWGDLRDLTADLPPAPARTGLPADIVASRRAPRSTQRRVAGKMIWTVVLPLAAGLAWPFSPVAVWLATIVISTGLLMGVLFDR
jgi:ferric-dicitrate binding protein FerR (iron transport regulator)